MSLTNPPVSTFCRVSYRPELAAQREMEPSALQTKERSSPVSLEQVDAAAAAYPFPLSPMHSLYSYSGPSSPATVVPLSPLDGHPPSYDNALLSGVPLAYSFSLLGTSASAMLLTPAHVESSADAQASYHISVGHDPFIPTHLVTSVVKGSNDQGLYVGGFKTAISSPNHPQQPVFINGGEYKLMDIFQKRKKKKGSQSFNWGNKQVFNMQWTCPHWPSAGKFTCHDPVNDNRIFAEFYVSASLTTNTPRAEPQLMVMPIGQTLFDDIVISVLLLERQRLTAALDPTESYSESRKASSPDKITD